MAMIEKIRGARRPATRRHPLCVAVLLLGGCNHDGLPTGSADGAVADLSQPPDLRVPRDLLGADLALPLPTFVKATEFDRPSDLEFALADFDLDGRIDLAEGADDGSIAVYPGKGDGTFGPPRLSLGNAGVNAAADFDGDGKADVVGIAGKPFAPTWDLYVAWGQGDGTFASPTTLLTVPSGLALFIVTADFNGDGLPDVAMTFREMANNTVQVVLNQGKRSFAAPVSTAAPDTVYGLLAGDVNRDGKADLVVVYGLITYLSDGKGGFAMKTSPAGAVGAAALGDLDGDGAPDIVAWDGGNSTLVVFLNDGAGGFTAGASYPSPGDDVSAIGIADFNLDGLPDAMATFTHQASGEIGVHLFPGHGDGTLEPSLIVPTDSWNALGIADLNGDHKPDFVLSNPGLEAFVNTTP